MADARLQLLLDLQDNVSKQLNETSKAIKGIEDRSKELQPVFQKTAEIGAVGFGAIAAIATKGLMDYSAAAAEMKIANLTLENSVSSLSGVALTKLQKEAGGAGNELSYLQEIMGQVSTKALQLGFDDEETAKQFAKLFSITGDVSRAQKDLTMAQDLAAFSGRDLTEAVQALVNVHAGRATVLREFGLNVKDLDSAEQALAIVHDRTAGAAERMATPMKKLGVDTGNLSEAIGKSLKPALDALVKAVLPIIEKITAWMEEHPKLTAAIIASTAAVFALLLAFGTLGLAIPAISAGLTALGGAFAIATGPVGLIVLAVMALIAAGVLLYKNWEVVKNFIIQHWEAIVAVLFPGIGLLVAFIVNNWTQIKDTTIAIWNGIKEFFTFVIALIVGIVEVGLNALGTSINGVMTWISTTFETILNFISNLWTSVWDGLKAFITPILTAIQGAINASFTWIKNTFLAIAEPIKTAWTSLWGSLGNIVSSTWEGIKSVVKESINWVIDKINAMIAAVNSVATKGAGVLHLSAPQIPLIPRLADGGIVDRPTLALIGEAGPEAVIPLSRSSRMAGAGAGSITINVSGNNFYGDQDLADKVMAVLTRELKINAKI